MTTEKKSEQPGAAHAMLHARILYRDCHGEVSDMTQDENAYGFGLKSLARMGATAVDELVRIHELLDVLALAAESRGQIDAALVRRVLEEVSTCLARSGELASYVNYTQSLFEEAKALPPLGEAEMEEAARSLALVS